MSTDPIVKFSKYHGAGNDFIMIDDRHNEIRLDQATVAHMCHRHFGIGADGLILLRKSTDAAYEMVYHNADGAIGSMCGNGARCAYAFAAKIGLADGRVGFLAYDGLHEAWRNSESVSITMRDVNGIEQTDGAFILDTGSPHYVLFVDHLGEVEVVGEGRRIRNSDRFRAGGINVNFVEIRQGHLRVSTYERGVEDRTLACGTGVTAVALAYAVKAGLASGPVSLKADGGELSVGFQRSGDAFSEIVLTGPAQHVYDGTWHPSRHQAH